jgi:hypothetical protein
MITLAIDLYKESLTLNHDNDRKYIWLRLQLHLAAVSW